MTDYQFTTEQVTEAMERAVAERGADYTFPDKTGNPAYVPGGPERMYLADDYHSETGACQYRTPDGTPACLIGLAMSYLAPELVPEYGRTMGASELVSTDGYYGDDDAGYPYMVPQSTAFALDDAQAAQDEGATWGEALERYKERVHGL